MIRMLLEGMLTDLGHTVAAEAGGIEEALEFARDADFDVALLDVNLNGKPIKPVVEVLVRRGRALRVCKRLRPARRAGSLSRRAQLCKSPSRPKLWRKPSKPRRRKPLLKSPFENRGELRHRRLVGDVDPQRRHGDAVIVEGCHIRAVLKLEGVLAGIGDPVIGIAAAILRACRCAAAPAAGAPAATLQCL